ncbi:MAG TPA: hypothetical protein VF702_09940 [Allosphingosinicella sp.]|jgi:hypothetical protein
MKVTAPAAAILLIVACRENGGGDAPRGETIECAIGGGVFERSCTVERSEGQAGLTLTLRNRRGGFRRLLLPRDGSGAIAADGAERAQVTVIADGRAEVAIGGDRFRLPVAIGPERR